MHSSEKIQVSRWAWLVQYEPDYMQWKIGEDNIFNQQLPL